MIAAAFLCIAATVIDGDTMRCSGIGRVRLAAIDAPELRGCRRPRRCVVGDARASRDHLAALIVRRAVHCRLADANPTRAGFQTADRWGRPVVRCRAGDRDLSAAQLLAGHAQPWPPRR